MRILWLLSLLAVLAGDAPRAQAAADSALAREVVAAIDIERQMAFASTALAGISASMPWVRVEPLHPTPATLRKVEAAAYAALLTDLRPELLREALAFMRSGVADRAMDLASRYTTPDALHEIVEAMESPDDAELADEATARRFHRVNSSTQEAQRMQALMMESLRKSVALRDRLNQRGIPAEEFFATMQDGMEDSDEPSDTEVFSIRYMLAQMAPADVTAMLAYGESDAGRYLQQTVTEPLTATLAEWMGAWLESFFLALFDTPPPPAGFSGGDVSGTGDPVEISLEPTPVRDPLPDADAPATDLAPTGVFDVVEQEPQLIGGLDGLAARLVYPEAARRDNAEGTVYVTFVVDVDGRTRHLSAVGVPSEALRSAALDVVQASRFTPGRQEGRPVRVRFTLPVRFVLH